MRGEIPRSVPAVFSGFPVIEACQVSHSRTVGVSQRGAAESAPGYPRRVHALPLVESTPEEHAESAFGLSPEELRANGLGAATFSALQRPWTWDAGGPR